MAKTRKKNNDAEETISNVFSATAAAKEAETAAVLSAQRSRILSCVRDISEKFESELTPENHQTYQPSFDRLKGYIEKFEALQDQVIVYNSTVSINKKALDVENIQKMFDDLVISIESKFLSFKPKNETCSKTAVTGSASSVHLPKIPLKKFSGELSDWPTFYNNFVSLIHNNPALDNMSKFHYLVSSLSGPPLNIATELTQVAENYEIVWNNLVKRYQNTRLLASNILNKFNSFGVLTRESKEHVANFLTVFEEGIQALKALKIKDLGDFLLLFTALRVLPDGTKRAFERKYMGTDIPTVKQLMDFMREQSIIHEVTQISRGTDQKSTTQTTGHGAKGQKSALLTAKQNSGKCSCCNENQMHFLYACPTFKKMSVPERRAFVKRAELCFNCLKKHQVKNCENPKRCGFCSAAHHSTLHFSEPPKSSSSTQVSNSTSPNSTGNTEAVKQNPSVSLTAVAEECNPDVLLGSALFKIKGSNGHYHLIRGIIDSGASCSFIVTSAARRIGLTFQPIHQTVSGIGGQASPLIKGQAICTIKPRQSDDPVLLTDTYVIDKITSELPASRLSTTMQSHFSGLDLADPGYASPGRIEFLVGADAFPYIYTGEKRITPAGVPTALSSIFGWVITGKVGHFKHSPLPRALIVTPPVEPSPVDTLLRKFWEIEEVPRQLPTHPDDLKCEDIFEKKHYRLPTGRYVTPLMLREDRAQLGESKQITLNRLAGIERRLIRNPTLKQEYSKFLEEYHDLGHMKEVPSENFGQAEYYIPHHFVTREDSATTRLRVVYDASQKTNTGFSLNDIVYTGPKLQQDIFDIMLKFRLYQVVFTCDVAKMYRQILILPEERKYQHIFWKKNDEIVEYELNTVSYGVGSAPYTAQRTLKQLVKDEGSNYPLASDAINKHLYVDDFVCGQNTIEIALCQQAQLIELLRLGEFELSKWASNKPELLCNFPAEQCVQSFQVEDENTSLKVLGINWDAKLDIFFYKAAISAHTITKRTILSHVGRLYDPLGLLSPIVLKAKIIMQQLWLQGIDWDSPVPPPLKHDWIQFCEKLPSIRDLKIERCVVLEDAISNCLIGFCDASQLAYAGAVYLRSESQAGVKVSLLAGKGRIAPTKTISIPRLELCSAQLLSTLIKHIKEQLDNIILIDQVATFTDSQVVLDWLKTHPCKLKTFEANRVTNILENVEPSAWGHVSSTENPADVASRSCEPDELANHPLWFTGPKWLTLPMTAWPKTHDTHDRIEEKVKTGYKLPKAPVLVATDTEFWEQLISKLSSLTRLRRVTAWILRFTKNLTLSPDQRVKNSTLSLQELNHSFALLIKSVQHKHFESELRILRKNPHGTKQFKSLQPFIDKDGLLRVGGRLRNAKLPLDATHPILLPKHDHFVNLIIDYYHKAYLHAGPRQLQSLLARKFWILAARSVIRSRLRKCHPCFKILPTNTQPIMGDLPSARVTQSRPFLEVGTDFGGPFEIREHSRRIPKLRNRAGAPKLSKAYVCLFICMATKAVHLEVVSDLSTDAFLACFDRFVSRRGLCRKLHSDNGTNYTGAKRHLSELYDFLLKNQNKLIDQLVERQVEWELIPPAAPHFGGVWEAGIKSAKHFLKKLIGDQSLTFEELSTIFAKIEAMMNSRPLCALSTDVSEVNVLTPAHFLIGSPMVAVPEYDVSSLKINRLSRWQLLQQITQQFWKVWSRDYLHTLIQRSKWHNNPVNIKPGDLVLIADDTPATQWKKGIIEEVHPGRDKVVRVVTVRTTSGTLKRPVVKVYPLPTE